MHYFLNESWSVGKSSLFVMYPRTPRGIILAAVDNSGGLNVYQLGWDFAQRSLQSSDTVAVMNVDSMGQPLCRSNIVDDLPNTRAVSFDGSVSDGPCGTSYSSPRAAWLLAFAAALGPPSANPDNWANEFQLLITKFRGPGQGLGKYALSPDKYVTLLEATVQ